MKRLRIAVVTPELPNREYPHRGGSVYQTLRQLCSYAEVQALCPLPRYPGYLRPRHFDYRESDLAYSLPDVPARYFAYPAVPFVTRPLNGYICAHYLEPLVRAFQADVILNFLLYPAGFAALSVGRRLRVPVIVGSMGSDLNAIPDPVSGWLTRKTLHGASRVITKSEQLRRRVLAIGVDPRKTHVVVNGCDDSLFTLRDRAAARREVNIPLNTELIVYVGRMHRRKGVYELLEAAAILHRTRPNVQLVYIGDGPELKTLREEARGSDSLRCVDFRGAGSSIDVARWLAAANLLVLPSYAEGCPNVVLEALSSGRPVVGTEVGAIPELVDRSCGILVPPGSVVSLANALESALVQSWDEAAISRRFRRSWRQVAAEVMAICESSCSEMRAGLN